MEPRLWLTFARWSVKHWSHVRCR